MWSNQLQFGFKKKSSCSRAIFVLTQVIDYYVKRNKRNVFVASLDATKAFDRVNHIKLFSKLIDRGLPGKLVKLIIDWYGKTFMTVKWNSCYSGTIAVKSGIRQDQGGILSPVFFNIYIDELINSLQKSDFGCHIGREYVGCIVYADDVLLLSASVVHLQ